MNLTGAKIGTATNVSAKTDADNLFIHNTDEAP
jgi:hypothetical protein